MGPQNLLVWNVHSLNASGSHKVVRELVIAKKPLLVCLQETKLHVLDDFLVMDIVGLGFDYAYLPAEQTSGGILVAWHSAVWSSLSLSTKLYLVSVRIRYISLNIDWWLTTVYGPSRDQDKPVFLS
jgi:exonuclease III